MKAKQAIRTLAITAVASFLIAAQPINAWAAQTPVREMTAFSQSTTDKQESYRIFAEGNAVALSINPITIDDKIYVPAKDIFEALGFTVTWDSKTNISSFISSNRYFKVDNALKTVYVDGKKTDITILNTQGRLMINVGDISSLANIDVVVSAETNQVFLTVRAVNKITFICNSKEVSYSRTWMLSGNKVWVDPSSIDALFSGLSTEISSKKVTVTNKYTGAVAMFFYDGRVEYSEAGSDTVIIKNYLDLFKEVKGKKVLSLSIIAECTGTTVSYESKDGKTVVRITSETAISASAEQNILDDKKSIALADDTIPLGAPTVPHAVYEQVTGRNPSVRDKDYTLNMTLAKAIIDEINVYRSNAGLNPVIYNSSLIYKPYAETNESRNSAFDNLRWCRENLNGRALAHPNLSDGTGEMLMQNCKSSVTAKSLVQTWYNSAPHKAIMLTADATEMGAVVIQYPNGDVDVAIVVHTK